VRTNHYLNVIFGFFGFFGIRDVRFVRAEGLGMAMLPRRRR